MRGFACLAAALALLACGSPARAQSVLPFAVEGRAGLAFPTGDFGRDLGLGYGLGANASFNILPLIAVYGGYSYTTFDISGVSRSTGDTYNLQGFDAGARVGIPTPLIPLNPYLRGGLVFYKANVSGGPSSDRNTGFQVGAGLNYALGMLVTLTPEVSYVRINGRNGSSDATFIRTDFGLRVHL